MGRLMGKVHKAREKVCIHYMNLEERNKNYNSFMGTGIGQLQSAYWRSKGEKRRSWRELEAENSSEGAMESTQRVKEHIPTRTSQAQSNRSLKQFQRTWLELVP